jgi:hypothetical protein
MKKITFFVRAGKAGYAPRTAGSGTDSLASIAGCPFEVVALSAQAGSPVAEHVVFTAAEAERITVADARQIGSFVTVRLAAVGPSTPLPPHRRCAADVLMASARGGPASWRTPARRAGTRADDKLQNHLIDSWLQPCGLGFGAVSAGAGGAGHKLVASIRHALLYVSPYRARFNLQELWLGAIDAAPRSPKHHGGRTTPCDQQKLLDLASDIGVWASAAPELKHNAWSGGAAAVSSLSAALVAGAAELQRSAERMQERRGSMQPAKLLQRDCTMSRRTPLLPANAAARAVAGRARSQRPRALRAPAEPPHRSHVRAGAL